MPHQLKRLAALMLLCLFVLGMGVVSAQTDEATPEVTPEVPAAEVTVEVPVIEVTEEPIIEITPEATPEPTTEAPAEATLEPTAEATLEPTAVPLEAEPALSLLFYDSFDSGDASNWLPAAGWFIADGMFQGINAGALTSQPAFLPTPANFYNVSAQARFKLNTGAVQISVRANEAVAYTASLDASGLVSLLRGSEVVATAATAPLTLDNWTDARISAYNGSVRVFIAGLPVIEWADAAPLPPGGVAITPVITAESILLVEDFVLWVPTTEFGNYPAAPTPVVVTAEPTVEVLPTEEVTVEPTVEVTAEPTVEVTEEAPLFDPMTGKSLIPFDAASLPPMAGPPPNNDNLADAALIGGVPYLAESTNAGAAPGRESGEITPAGCGFNISYTVWFEFTPATTGNYNITTEGTAFDTILGLYTDDDGGVFPLTQVACNDDVSGSLQARLLNRPLTAGTTYYIQLGGYNGNRGPYRFSVQQAALPVPAAPTLVAPLNRALLGAGEIEVVFSWTAPLTSPVAPTNYNIQIDNQSNFSSPLINENINGLTETYEIPDGRWYWRVRSLNINGLGGAWSARREFTQDNTEPGIPTLKAPADDSTINTNRPTLTWNKVATAASYRVDLVAVGGANILTDFPTNSTSLPLRPTVIANPLPQGCYEWVVRARDAVGNVGDDSDEFRFCVNLARTPANGSSVIDATLPAQPRFVWSPLGVTGATYVIEIATDDDFTNIVHESADITAATYTVPATELDLVAGTYFWRVIPNGVTPPAEIFFSFIVSPSTPPRVNLTAPASGAVLFDNTPTLDWTDVPPATTGGPFTYELVVSTSNKFLPANEVLSEDVIAPLSDFTPGSPLDDAKYFWRVRVRNSLGTVGTWSAVRSFTIDTIAKQIAPANGSFSIDDTPTFKWDRVPGATTYRLVVDDNADLSSPLAGLYQGTGTSFTIPLPGALSDGLWHWGVQFSFNGTDFSPVGDIEPWEFTVIDAFPTVPLITSPLNNGSVADTRPTFTWSPVTGAAEYLCQLSSDSRFRTFVHQDVVAGTTCTEPSEELAEGRYYARVLAYNALGAPGRFSRTLVFFVDITPPPAPTFASPANGSTSTSTAPVITWRRVTGATKYDIRFGTALPLDDSDIPGNGSDIPTTRYTASVLPGETYYFQVRALDAANNESDWSAVLSIKIVSPANVAPIPNRTSDPTPLLTWTPISWATDYEVEISRTNTFAVIVQEDDTIGTNPTSWSPPADLAEGTYYWRVRAKIDADSWGGWSSVGIFLVDF